MAKRAPKPKVNDAQLVSLIGHYFRAHQDGNPATTLMGVILSEPYPGLFLVEVEMPDPRNAARVLLVRRLIALDVLRDWLFYPNDDAMREAANATESVS